MSKKRTKWILPATEKGWELWGLEKGKGKMLKTLEAKTGKQPLASVALPVRATSCELVEVMTAEPEIEKAMALVELESTISGSQDSRSLDAFFVSRNASEAIYTGVVIEPSSLETQSAWIDSSFDWSPRCFTIDEGMLIWKEQGRWAYACYLAGKPVFADLLASGELANQLSGLLPVIKPRLMMLGLDFDPLQATVADVSVDIEACQQALGIQVVLVERDQLISLPSESLSYAPGFVAKLMVERKQAFMRSVLLMAGLLFVGLLILVTSYSRRELQKQIEAKQEIVNASAELVEDNLFHNDKWSELESVVENDWPLNLYEEVASAIPRKQDVSLESIKITRGLIEIKGKARDYTQAKRFGENLEQGGLLKEYSWEGKTESGSTIVRSFTYKGEQKEELYP